MGAPAYFVQAEIPADSANPPVTAVEAFQCSASLTDYSYGQLQVLDALFGVLTQSQQERVIAALGWTPYRGNDPRPS